MEDVKTRTMCMQLSVQAARWPDDMLAGAFNKPDGTPTTGQEARKFLQDMAAEGYTCVPCGRHECDETGQCLGTVVDQADD